MLERLTMIKCASAESTRTLKRYCFAQSALENNYIEPLINDNTGLIEDDLPAVLVYPNTNYGKVQSKEVKQKETEVLSTSFDTADPIVVLFPGYCYGNLLFDRTTIGDWSNHYLVYEGF